MDARAAVQAVQDLGAKRGEFGASEQDRAKLLLADPDQLNQGYYGTCGMAAIVRSLLRHDRAKFVELLHAVYEGTPFHGIATGDGVLLKGRLKQRDRKAARHGAQYYDAIDLDFILLRSLGKLLKIQSPKMYESQTLFSEEIARLFNAKQPYLDICTLDVRHSAVLDTAKVDDRLLADLGAHELRLKQLAGFGIDRGSITVEVVTPDQVWNLKFTAGGAARTLQVRRILDHLDVGLDVQGSEVALRNEGDLGLDAVGLAYLAERVVGLRRPTVTKATPATAAAAVAAVNAQLAGPAPYVYAFILSFDDWSRANHDDTQRTFPGAPTPPAPIWGRVKPEGEHIIAINGPIRTEGRQTVVPVWTWANAFEVRMPTEHLAGYLPIFVHGTVV